MTLSRNTRGPRRLAAQFALLLPCALPASAEERFVDITRLDGTSLSGELRQVFPVILLKVASGDEALNWSDVLSLTPRGSQPRESAARGPFHVTLADGSSIDARIVAAGDGRAALGFGDGQLARLDLSAIRSIVAVRPPEAARQQVETALASAQPNEDLAVVAQGDRTVTLNGALREVLPTHAVFSWNGRDLRLPLERVAALRLARPTPRGADCRVTLTSREVIAGRVVSGDDRRLSVQSATLGRVELSWEGVMRIDCAGDKLTFLSDLRPARYDFTPLFHKRWPFASDRSLLGGPLRLGGRTYSRGVAMRSRAVLTYAVAGEFRQFAATVGVSDEMEQHGWADVAVLGDGRTLWAARDLRGGQPAREVLIDVSGVHELTLFVDYGGDLDVADHVIWALARLIR
ncbi:MAG TPA: NPCBM/NEW2 domain-containing protein [Phycisphaerae bacterium]|nr:NPCBM/NEW2 domain-containing protein [Phycisphaerae bacterium]